MSHSPQGILPALKDVREGDTLERNGTGNFQFGYPSIALRAGFGALMDEVTGLLYVGNGQYYDPSTGRFLTRNANPNSQRELRTHNPGDPSTWDPPKWMDDYMRTWLR